MKNFLFFFLLVFLCACNNNPTKVEGTELSDTNSTSLLQKAEPFAVVELFTSEGCSDCPSAEEVLNKITMQAMADKSYIYPLSFHVDYWNKLGWKDIFSDSLYSNRQRKYRVSFGNEFVYTPQMIVNGKKEFEGSDSVKATTTITEALKEIPAFYFSIHPNEDWTSISYEIISMPFKDEQQLSGSGIEFCIALVERNLTTQVKRGENEGKTLQHENVVRMFNRFPLQQNKGSYVLPKFTKPLDKNLSLITYLQDPKTMHILGANLWNY